MRVLLINSYYAPTEIGGAERSVRFIAEQLVARGNQVTVFTTLTNEPRRTEELAGVRIHRANTRSVEMRAARFNERLGNRIHHLIDQYRPTARTELRDVINEFSPDVAHTNNLSGLSISVLDELSSQGIPIVHTLRDYSLLCANNALRKGESQCGPSRCAPCVALSAIKKPRTQLVDVVVGNSKFILDKHLEYGLFENSSRKTIYNGFSTNANIEARKHPKSDGRPFVFGYIGMLTPRKGISYLIDAFRSLHSVRPNIELIVAGAPPSGETGYLEALADKARGLPIKFIGTVRQEHFFSQIDCCILPSLWDEPLSRVIFESFVFSVPIISSTTGGSPELITHGVTGLLFNPAENGALIEQMSRMMGDKNGYEMISLTSLEISKNFHPDVVVDNYIEAYQDAIKKKMGKVT